MSVMIETVFNNHIEAIANSFDLSIAGKDAAEKIEYLHKITRDNANLSKMLKHYANFVSEKNNVELANVPYDYELSKNVAEVLFLRVLSGAVNIYARNDAPKTHHWLPVVYIKSFSTSANPSRKRRVRAEVDAVSFNSGSIINASVNDLAFAHDRDGDNGFYDLSVESFFGGLESNLAKAKEVLSSDENSFSGVTAAYVASFFIVQSVRNPHPSEGFASGEFKTVIRQVMENFTKLGEIYVNFGNSAKRLPFSPYVPDRVRVKGTTKIFHLPLDPFRGAIISNAPISSYDTDPLISQFRKSSIRFAKKNNGMLFGLNSSDI